VKLQPAVQIATIAAPVRAAQDPRRGVPPTGSVARKRN